MRKDTDVSELCKSFLESRDGVIKESSYMRYQNQIQRHIEPYFNGVKADGLTAKQIEDFYKCKLLEGLSENYVHSLGVLLRTIYTYGERMSGIPNIPAKVELIKRKAGKVDTLNDRDILKVLRYGGLPEKIALSMGLRIGEICGLKGDAYRDGSVSIASTIQRIEKRTGGTKLYIGKPKTADSARKVPVPEHLKQIFEEVPGDRFIIGGVKPCEPRVIAYRWKRFCEDMGIGYIKFHGLRHTFATKAIESGMDTKTLSEILGHADVCITMNLYCHPSEKHKEESIKKLWEGIGI